MAGAIDLSGGFLRAEIGSPWLLDGEMLTLRAAAAWTLRAPSARTGGKEAGLAVLATPGGALRHVRWVRIEGPRGAPVQPFRYVDRLEPGPPVWDAAVPDAIAAAGRHDPATGREAVIVDPAGRPWASELDPVARVERAEGPLPFDPARVGHVIELHDESVDPLPPDGVWLLCDRAGRVLAAYGVEPHSGDRADPVADRGLLAAHRVRLVTLGLAVGLVVLVASRLL
jgi:hypothetical protein